MERPILVGFVVGRGPEGRTLHISAFGTRNLHRLATAGLRVDLHCKFDRLTIRETSESLHLDLRLMHEHVGRTIRGNDEPKPIEDGG